MIYFILKNDNLKKDYSNKNDHFVRLVILRRTLMDGHFREDGHFSEDAHGRSFYAQPTAEDAGKNWSRYKPTIKGVAPPKAPTFFLKQRFF